MRGGLVFIMINCFIIIFFFIFFSSFLYNCLNLYVVSSRYEGGPRSIVEAGLTKTPIISTRVGIAEEFMPKESLFDVDNWLTYKNARPNTETLYKNIIRLTKDDHMIDFKNKLVM